MIRKKMTLFVSVLAGLWAADVMKEAKAKVHCNGVSMKWVNDCASKVNGHSCAFKAKKDFDPEEFLSMSQADCNAVKKALKNPAVKNYVKRIRSGTVAAIGRGKEF